MAKKSGLAGQFYVHGRDLSGDISAINNAGSPRGLLEVPGLNQSAMHRVMGLSDGMLDVSTWFNDATGQAHDAYKGLVTTDVILLYAQGGAVGDVVASLVAKQINYDGTRNADGSLPLSVRSEGNGTPLEWMNLLTAGKVTQASSGNGAAKDDAVSSANGAAAVLEVVDIDSGTPTVVIEDSPDNAVWATLISFTAVADGGEPTAERKTVSGTVDRYLRYNVTGTFTNLDFVVAYRRGTAQDDVAL